ncbi:hypothetical protein BDZ89DRAFT_470372 [Hymenopellis radicata]|nr:hypothetical protein BDZ89DRAFT_470372 [Hymenopellis radicata]
MKDRCIYSPLMYLRILFPRVLHVYASASPDWRHLGRMSVEVIDHILIRRYLQSRCSACPLRREYQGKAADLVPHRHLRCLQSQKGQIFMGKRIHAGPYLDDVPVGWCSRWLASFQGRSQPSPPLLHSLRPDSSSGQIRRNVRRYPALLVKRLSGERLLVLRALHRIVRENEACLKSVADDSTSQYIDSPTMSSETSLLDTLQPPRTACTAVLAANASVAGFRLGWSTASSLKPPHSSSAWPTNAAPLNSITTRLYLLSIMLARYIPPHLYAAGLKRSFYQGYTAAFRAAFDLLSRTPTPMFTTATLRAHAQAAYAQEIAVFLEGGR